MPTQQAIAYEDFLCPTIAQKHINTFDALLGHLAVFLWAKALVHASIQHMYFHKPWYCLS